MASINNKQAAPCLTTMPVMTAETPTEQKEKKVMQKKNIKLL